MQYLIYSAKLVITKGNRTHCLEGLKNILGMIVVTFFFQIPIRPTGQAQVTGPISHLLAWGHWSRGYFSRQLKVFCCG